METFRHIRRHLVQEGEVDSGGTALEARPTPILIRSMNPSCKHIHGKLAISHGDNRLPHPAIASCRFKSISRFPDGFRPAVAGSQQLLPSQPSILSKSRHSCRGQRFNQLFTRLGVTCVQQRFSHPRGHHWEISQSQKHGVFMGPAIRPVIDTTRSF